MKKLITLLLFACFAQIVFAQNILPRPNPPKLVNDVAGVLSPEQREILEQKLVALDDSSSNQIAVVLCVVMIFDRRTIKTRCAIYRVII